MFNLSDSSWTSVLDAVHRFEREWRRNGGADLSQFVPPSEDPLLVPTLVPLIEVDQELRWDSGERRPLEAYLDQWPELRNSAEIVIELYRNECAIRAMEPTSEDLQERFPDIGGLGPPELQVALHREQGRGFMAGTRTACADADVESLASRSDTTSLTLDNTPNGASGDGPFPQGYSLGRYQILELLEHGGMGWVYRAYDENPSLPRVVALKIPKFDKDTEPALIDRFLREAKAAGSLQHPNICPVFEAGEVDGTCFISMPLIEGKSLKSWLESGDVSPQEAAEMTCRIARALAAAHAKGIIHRDMKPSNVMVDQSGDPLILDFGLARLMHDEDHRNRDHHMHDATPNAVMRRNSSGTHRDELVTEPGAVLGTLPYMSPEQAEGCAIDARSDVFSLGVILYEMLTRELPYPPQKTIEDTRRALREIDPDRPRSLRDDLQPQLEAICLRAMAKDAADRFASASDFAQALDRFLEERGQRIGRMQRTKLMTRVLAVACFVFWVLGLGVYFKTGKGSLTLTVDEPNVRVTVDGKQVEIESIKKGMPLAVGWHEIEAIKEGFQTQNQSFKIRWRGGRAEIHVEMTPVECARLAMASFLGGSGIEQILGIDTNRNGYSAMTGWTDSTDLPLAEDSEPPANNVNDVFVARTDPQGKLEWTTYMGGPDYETGNAVAVGDEGHIYITGWTQSIPLAESLDPTPAGGVGREAFVAKYAPSGELLWTRLLGGIADDDGTAIHVDPQGNVLVAGSTRSSDFRGVSVQGELQGGIDCFLAKITAEGDIEWISLFGGSDDEQASGVAVNACGEIFLCGDTFSGDLSGRANVYCGGQRDAYVAKLDSTGKLIWSRYLGGQDQESASSLCLDSRGNIVVCGWTASVKFPSTTFESIRRLIVSRGRSHDAFVAKYDARGKSVWAVILGGSDEDEASDVAVDQDGNILVAGQTRSMDFPTAGGFRRRLKGSCDGFVAKLSQDAQLRYATLVGGDDTDVIAGLGVSAEGDALVAGWTSSADFPVRKAFDVEFSGRAFDGIVAQITCSDRQEANTERPYSLPVPEEMRVVWEHEFSRDKGGLIPRVKLTPDGRQLVVFHYTDTSVARVTKLDVRTGQTVMERTYDVGNRRVTMNGWVDHDGNLYLMSAFWYKGSGGGDGHFWKLDPDLKTELWHCPGGPGFEYVLNAVTDDAGNVYAAGYSGSRPGIGSGCVKLNSDGKSLWPERVVKHAAGTDSYAFALALDSERNLYRVGNDDAQGPGTTCMDDCARLLVHRSQDGQLVLDRSLDDILPRATADGDRTVGGSVFGGVLVDDERCIWIACTMDRFGPKDMPSKKERTVLLKLDRSGNLLNEYDFPGTGTYVERNALLEQSNGSFYIAYQQRYDGAVYPAFAEFSFDGKPLWNRKILKRGWDQSSSGFDARDGKIYVALSDMVNPGAKTCVLALDAMVEPDPHRRVKQ